MPVRSEPEPFSQQIGWRIEDLRLEKNLTMEAVAYRCGTAKGHLSNVERGLAAATAKSLAKIAKGLGERVFTLLLFPKEDRFDRLVDELRKLTPAQRKQVETFVKELRRQG
jgi:transcriptional regulator with XRE-family HTH domain